MRPPPREEGRIKTRMMGLPVRKKFDDIFSSVDTIHQRVGRTDGRTDGQTDRQRVTVTAQSRANGLLGPQLQPAYQAYTAPQSTTLNLHPVIHVPNYMDHYSFTDP